MINIVHMRIMLRSVLFIALLAQWCYPADQTTTEEPAARIISLSGNDVRVQDAWSGREASARPGMILRKGDVVRTSASSSCSVLLTDGQLVKIPSNSSYAVGTQPTAALSVLQIVSDMATDLVRAEPLSAKIIDSNMPLRTRGKEDDSTELLPKDYTVLTQTPRFEWNNVAGALRYVLTITNKEGDSWVKEVEDTGMDYPSDFPKLALGESYFWQVDAVFKRYHKELNSATFVVVDEENKKALENLRSKLSAENLNRERSFLLAMAFQKHDLLDEAIAEYKNLIEVEPGFVFAYEQLGLIYAKMGRTDQAIDLLKKVAELDPSAISAHESLAALYRSKGDQDKAKAEQEIVDKMALAAGATGRMANDETKP